MKFLVAIIVLAGTCLAQDSHSRRFSQQQQQQQQQKQQQQQQHQQQQQQQQHEDHNQQYQQPPQQYQENRRPHELTTFIPIIRFDKEQGADGSYKTLWETGNHILAQEEGYLKDLGPDPDSKGDTLRAQVQQGSFTYTAPNGEVIVTRYTADETGFHVEGDHLPTPPPVSPEVQKGLDLIYAGIRQQQEQAASEYNAPEGKQSQEYREPARQPPRNQLQQEYNRPNQYQEDYNGPQRQRQ